MNEARAKLNRYKKSCKDVEKEKNAINRLSRNKSRKGNCEKRTEHQEMLKDLEARQATEKIKLQNYIDTIDDVVVRDFFTAQYIERKKIEEIAAINNVEGIKKAMYRQIKKDMENIMNSL